MDLIKSDEILDLDIDLFGTLPALNVYNQVALIYSTHGSFSTESAVATLRAGLERLSANFPWLAGQVVNGGAAHGVSGAFKIKSYEPTPGLTIKDHRGDGQVPTFDELQSARYPIRLLDESWVCPIGTFPDESGQKSPCFLMQANIIEGGLILTFLGQHQVIDGVAMGEIVRLLSKACRSAAFTDEEIRVGNLPREGLVPLLGPGYKPGPELDYQTQKPGTAAWDPSTEMSKCRWGCFAFGPTAQGALKREATASKPAACEFISTDDSLTAFLWQSITRVREQRITEDNTTHLVRAVDVRSLFDVPAQYSGMFQYSTFFDSTMKSLPSQPLGEVAARLRAALDPVASNLKYEAQAFCTMLNRLEDKMTMNFTANLNMDASISLTSWGRMNLKGMDFGLGVGGPEAIRRPQFTPIPGMTFLLPKARDGEIVAEICLRNEDLDALSRDEQFLKYARYIA